MSTQPKTHQNDSLEVIFLETSPYFVGTRSKKLETGLKQHGTGISLSETILQVFGTWPKIIKKGQFLLGTKEKRIKYYDVPTNY
ncbi:hypothetical protein CHISP_3616 [Chitinispirillum alkaliphilum]|nr:hypothetical protein CHISP_3616 [Chitinispirillum alkaliphilum]